jgi:hypothetical protein
LDDQPNRTLSKAIEISQLKPEVAETVDVRLAGHANSSYAEPPE